MKEIWYMVLVLLMLSLLASLANLSSPTGAMIINLPPQWDYPTTEFTGRELELDLNTAFFDPDGDPISFSVSPGVGISAGVVGDTLLVQGTGIVTVVASDGKNLVPMLITVYN